VSVSCNYGDPYVRVHRASSELSQPCATLWVKRAVAAPTATCENSSSSTIHRTYYHYILNYLKKERRVT
jgi:hypothetical protein